MPMELVKGGLGSFKTAFITDGILVDADRGIKCYSNYKINHPKVKCIPTADLLKLKKIHHASVNIDEIQTLIDSRVSGSHVNRFFSYFGFQSRKIGVKVRSTAQLMNSVDFRFTDLCSKIYVAQGLNEVDDFVEYEWADDTGESDEFAVHLDYFKYFVFPYYDTNEVIEPIRLDEIIVELEKQSDYVAFNNRIDKACSKFLKKYELSKIKKLDKRFVDNALVRLHEPESLGKYVYNRLVSEHIL